MSTAPVANALNLRLKTTVANWKVTLPIRRETCQPVPCSRDLLQDIGVTLKDINMPNRFDATCYDIDGDGQADFCLIEIRFLPSVGDLLELIDGIEGGGTRLPTASEMLSILNCHKRMPIIGVCQGKGGSLIPMIIRDDRGLRACLAHPSHSYGGKFKRSVCLVLMLTD
jgi:hypothetical protein